MNTTETKENKTERNIDKLKVKNKGLAKEIQDARIEHKETQRGNLRKDPVWKTEARLKHLQYEFRHHHIAYCELRGRTRDQIEQTHRDDTPTPDEGYIRAIKDMYAWTPEEIEKYNERQAKREAFICTNP